MSNPPVDVQTYGQSIWMDNIRRDWLEDGTFQRMIDAQGVVGVTSNPTIFQKAIGNSDDYDDTIRSVLDLAPADVYERLAVEDIQRATDLFRLVYERTAGKDGYVSLEVSPLLAHNTEETITEAKRLYAAVDRPNVMIKIPATQAGIPAIEETIAAGINVNVTLIFAVETYMKVAEAYIRGLERRLEAGEDVTKIASVASFFLSRIDVMVDQMLENNIHAAKVQGDSPRVQANSKLLGKTAIANAKLAYKRFMGIFYGERFEKLRQAGAAVQRPLWASTSTKNPAYPDTLYIDNLIGKDTVNTVPPKTLDAFSDHGTATGETILEDIDKAEQVLDMLAELGIDMDQVAWRLQDDGVEAFIESFERLIDQVEAKTIILETGIIEHQKLALGVYHGTHKDALTHLDKLHFNARIWHKDGSLWKDDGPTINKIEKRLGWLDVRSTIDIERLKTFQAELKDAATFTHVVLLGMGGSSLAPEVFMQTFGNAEGFPELLVLDSTHPAQIQRVQDAIDISKTLFIVASKSGGTVETLSLYRYFFPLADENGAQFIAITDPGSKLQTIAEENNFRELFLNPADIGGRYSALSYFGLVPAATIGVDLNELWRNAEAMMKACSASIPAENHPALILGSVLGALGKEGRDKIAIFASKEVSAFGSWVEQLVAESVGKEKVGLVPVVGATVGRPHDYDSDRLLIYLKLTDDPSNPDLIEGIKALREAGHPRVTITMEDKYALAGEFFRWEYATAVAGQMMDINPFDEPNVTESKNNTNRLLDHFREQGTLPHSEPQLDGESVQVFMDERTIAPLRDMGKAHEYSTRSRTEMIAAQITGTHAGEYFALLAYLPSTPQIDEKLSTIQRRLRHATRRAVTLGYGPRYLHSTGQLHKGGPNKGVFFIITAEHTHDLNIPGADYSFATLNDAQAQGDMQALQTHERRAIRLHINGDVLAGLDKLLDAIDFVDERRSK